MRVLAYVYPGCHPIAERDASFYPGAASWYDVASAIVDELGLAVPVTPTTTADWPTAAARPRRG